MGTAVFDPALHERGEIKILDATYTVAELTKKRAAKAEALEKDLKGIDDAEDLGGDAAVAILARMLEVSLEESSGLAERIVAAWDAEEVSMQYLTRAIAWITEQQQERAEQGNG